MLNIIEKYQFESDNEYVELYKQNISGTKKQSGHLKFENELVKLYTQGNEGKSSSVRDSSLIDKKKGKTAIKGNTHNQKAKINNYFIKHISDIDTNNKKNSYISSNSHLNVSSQKNSYLLFDGERLNSTTDKYTQAVNYGNYPERKRKVTGNRRGVSNQKHKARLLKRMFIHSDDNNNPFRDEEDDKIKKVILPEVNNISEEKRKTNRGSVESNNNSMLNKTKLQAEKRNNTSSSILKHKHKILLHKERDSPSKKGRTKKVQFQEASYIKKTKLNIPILKPNETQTTPNLTQIAKKHSHSQNNNGSSSVDNNKTHHNNPQINNNNINVSNKNEKKDSHISKDISPEIRKPQFRIVDIHQVKPTADENTNTLLPTQRNPSKLNLSISNTKELSYTPTI